MDLHWTRITDSTAEPITLAEAKTHLRVDTSGEDTYITSLISVARETLEYMSNRVLLSQTWDILTDTLPGTFIELNKGPLQSVTSISYNTSTGGSTAVGSTIYRSDNAYGLGRITLQESQSWPTIQSQLGGVTTRVVLGESTDVAGIPYRDIHAVKLLVSHLYHQREPVVTGTIATEIPKAFDWLIRREYRF